MKKTFFLIAISASLCVHAQSKKDLKKQVETLQLKNDSLQTEVTELEQKQVVDMNDAKEKFSYALGANVVENLKAQGLDSIDAGAFAKGMEDAQNNAAKISPEEGEMLIQKEFQRIQEAKAAEAKEEGEKYLAENGKKEGVVTTASGLQYEVIKEGTGPKPASTNEVTVHYHGMLTDGTVFDSSVQRGTPATFPVTGVIQGWVEALQLMPQGSKWKLTIPYNLAYGERGTRGIPPYATLIFEVELISIQ